MAKYRTYKNGVYGTRHKGYYIKKEDKRFCILDKQAQEIGIGFDNADDCEWYIDKVTASAEELEMLKGLYSKEIFELSAALVRLIEKKNAAGLTKNELVIYEYISKIRKRKADDKEF